MCAVRVAILPPSRSALKFTLGLNLCSSLFFCLAFIARPLEAQEERKEHGIASKRLHMTGRDVYLSVTIFPSGLKH